MLGTSLTVQWLRLYTSNAGGVGLIPNQRTKLSHASGVGWQKKNVNGGYVRRWDNEQMISLLCFCFFEVFFNCEHILF